MAWLRSLVAVGLAGVALGCDGGASDWAAAGVAGSGAVGPSWGGGGPVGGLGGAASGAGGANGGQAGASMENPTGMPVLPMEPALPRTYLRKVKSLLTGLAPTEAEVQSVTTATDPKQALMGLIDTWTSPDHADLYDKFREKMIFFFTNAFQQKGFTPTEDFKHQLLENAGFDLGPLGIYGDDAFPRLVQNLEESFARTAWDIAAAGRPFTEVLTTPSVMMTTALMSLYIQVEMPNDQPYAFGARNGTPLAW